LTLAVEDEVQDKEEKDDSMTTSSVGSNKGSDMWSSRAVASPSRRKVIESQNYSDDTT